VAELSSSATDGLAAGILAAIADVSDEIVGGDEAEGKKCKDDVHGLLLFSCFG
jgi:hypothetical protein